MAAIASRAGRDLTRQENKMADDESNTEEMHVFMVILYDILRHFRLKKQCNDLV